MGDYYRKVRSVSSLVKNNESVFANSPSKVLQIGHEIDLDTQVLRIIETPVLMEKYYLRGYQQPFNTFYNTAQTVHLRGNGSSGEITTTSEPMYRLRREAFIRLHKERRKMLREGIDEFIQRKGLSWKPGGKDGVTRFLTINDAIRSLDEYLFSHNSDMKKDKIKLSTEYGHSKYADKGATIWYEMPSITADGKYSKEKNLLHSLVVYEHDGMILTNAQIRSRHMCGRKGNLETFFKGATKNIEVLDLHEGKAYLKFLEEVQDAMREGKADKVYDPLERTWASIPMYLNWLPLATPNELNLFRVLAYNTTIQRPKRDHKKGGFLRASNGDITYDKERPLWEAEIEAIMWTAIADLSEKAMFIRQKVVDLPFHKR